MHFEQGQDYRRAVQYHQRAAERATRRSAYQEAIRHLVKGLDLLKTFPDTPERIQHELTLQVRLGESLRATSGHGAPEVERVYVRARALCQQVGESPQLFPVQLGLWVFYNVRAEYHTARELAEQLLTLAHRVQNPDSLLIAHLAMGLTLFFLGEFAPARKHLEQGITLYNSQEHYSRAGKDLEVRCLSYAAGSLGMLGYPDQAVKRSHEALSLAQEFAHPFVLAEALNLAAAFHLYRKEGQTAQERAEQSLALCTEHEFAYTLALGTSQRGEALARQGHVEEGIALMRQGQTAWQATGTEATRSSALAVLAEMYGEVGRAEEGLSLLAEALTYVHKTGERFYEAELYRVKGELSLKSGVRSPGSEAEECFHKAIDIARQQSAKSWELRAVMSLSRLWQQQGKKNEAHEMLAEIYNWFTEGFETADLQEAKALLEELA